MRVHTGRESDESRSEPKICQSGRAPDIADQVSSNSHIQVKLFRSDFLVGMIAAVVAFSVAGPITVRMRARTAVRMGCISCQMRRVSLESALASGKSPSIYQWP
jgi:hypothetical protein